MKEAYDHNRVTREGREMGANMARLADAECAALAVNHDEPDDRCRTCAFRAGTVPNGCMQTMGDATKAVIDKDGKGRYDRICHGWFAVRRVVNRARDAGAPLPAAAPWEFSPPDDTGDAS
jgi:hypothetical protein